MQATRDPVVQAEIENDQPYRSFNRDALEEHDRATENLRQERREFIESILKNGYAKVKRGREYQNYYLTEAIAEINNKEFWLTKVTTKVGGEFISINLHDLFDHYSSYDDIADLYMNGKLPQWHTEIHKQVVILADMALGEV